MPDTHESTLPLPIRVERLAQGGDGVGRAASGQVVFVPGAFPGDEVLVRASESKARFAKAQQWELLSPGANRREPPCPIAGTCGGCAWMGLPEEQQRDEKRTLLTEALERIGKLETAQLQINEFHGPDFAYRNRVRIQVVDGVLGFFAKGTRRLVPIEACAVLTPELQQSLDKLRRWTESHPEMASRLAEVQLRHLGVKPSIVLRLKARTRTETAAWRDALAELKDWTYVEVHQPRKGKHRKRRLPRAASASSGAASDGLNPLTDWERVPLASAGEMVLPPGGFNQVNWPVNSLIIAHLLQGVSARKITRFADLYCGAGNFSLPLLAEGLSGYGVESSARLIQAARASCELSGLAAESYISADAAEQAKRWVEEGAGFELILCDPPRSGLRETAKWLPGLKAKYLFLCSCDAPTFARDLHQLTQAGYRIEELNLYDMFPQTPHFETSAWLTRG